MLRTPKELFATSPQFGAWKEVVNLKTDAFELACHTAMQELLNDLPIDSPNPSLSWDKYNQLAGARRFADILARLHEPQQAPKKTQWPELNHNV